MIYKKILMKTITVCVIVLLMGTVFSTSIHANNVKTIKSKENVEISIEFCVLDQVGSSKSMIDSARYSELISYLNDLETKLKNATLKQEVIKTINETLAYLQNIEVIPSSWNINGLRDSILVNLYDSDLENLRQNTNLSQQELFNKNRNFCCIVAGSISNTISINSRFIRQRTSNYLIEKIIENIESWAYKKDLNKFKHLMDMLETAIESLRKISTIYFHLMKPSILGAVISLGYQAIHTEHASAKGWLYTFGVSGIKSWNNSFIGDIPPSLILEFLRDYTPIDDFLEEALYLPDVMHPGIIGYSGLKFCLDADENNIFYLGSALWVKVQPK